ncbi:hypothetical protein EDD18DRAFT_860117 [Armillaria luteobubalina]|uniref:F-box domain-containing protein n=1 Tax=Armillaria luteobubalina TaxID=153913 RepID=A0AA39UZQ8_9AGAR|nr:hypothetical protein EDD18DRAFT_860117 [Armillaria luteobubalina]
MVSLPQELLDIIVDELGQDLESLRALHSTSPSFRDRVQSHLFRSIHLPQRDSCHSFLELCTASPNIPDFVQALEITVFVNRDAAYQALSLPNLRSLRINGGPSINPRHPSRVGIHKIPSSLLAYSLITSLTLDSLNIKSAQHMRNLLCSFATLRTLEMNQIRVCATGSVDEDGEPGYDDGPVIEDLSISFTSYNLCDMKILLEIKGKPFLLRGLRRFSCAWTQNWHGIRGIKSLLHATKRTLQELHLCHSDLNHWAMYQTPHILDFSHIPCVIFEAPRRENDRIIGLNWFMGCLEFQEDGPARISQLRLSLCVHNFEILSDQYRTLWRDLDGTLTAHRFASLEKFNISVVIDGSMAATGEQNEDRLDFPQMEQTLSSFLPTLHEQKKVLVQVVGS